MAQCTARSKQSGKQCQRPAAAGQEVCASHGAKSPQARAAAQRRLAQQQTEMWLLEHLKDAEPMTSLREVYDEMLAVAGTARTMRLVLQQRVSELTSTGYQGDGPAGEQVRADVLLLERALDRSAKVMDLIARLNIDERKERLTREQGGLIALAVRRILDALDLTPDQLELVPTVVPRELRALAAPQEQA